MDLAEHIGDLTKKDPRLGVWIVCVLAKDALEYREIKNDACERLIAIGKGFVETGDLDKKSVLVAARRAFAFGDKFGSEHEIALLRRDCAICGKTGSETAAIAALQCDVEESSLTQSVAWACVHAGFAAYACACESKVIKHTVASIDYLSHAAALDGYRERCAGLMLHNSRYREDVDDWGPGVCFEDCKAEAVGDLQAKIATAIANFPKTGG